MLAGALLMLLQETLPDGALLRLTGHSDAVKAVAWSPDGRSLLTAGRDRTLASWDVATGKRLRVFEGHEGGVTSVAFSPDGRFAVSGSQDKTVALWDVAAGRILSRHPHHALWVTCVAWSPDGRRVLSGSLDRTAVLWDVAAGPTLQNPQPVARHGGRVMAAAFTPDGGEAATSSGDRSLIFWDLEKGVPIRKFAGPESIECLSIRPDGARVLGGTWLGTVQSWDVGGKEEERAFKGHPGVVSGVSYSPDGLTYASACQVEMVMVDDAVTGKRLARLHGHRGHVWSVAWSPSGLRLASSGEEGTVVIWDPWRGVAGDGEAWLAAWKARPPEARVKELREFAAALTSKDAAVLARARDRLHRAGDEGVPVLLEAFAPDQPGIPAPAEVLERLLRELDADEFAARVRAKKELFAVGRVALPWIEKQLVAGDALSAEVRGALADVRDQLRSAKGAPPDDGRGRAIPILAEMPRSEAVSGALKRYAEGPEESPATRPARRALGR
ncbi:MAG TPA: WD40 repeat domain-containing protein [Planctomycetota bacterium]|nr:WD40 repeat domain-containing protein [Planctomycetota bacterium]